MISGIKRSLGPTVNRLLSLASRNLIAGTTLPDAMRVGSYLQQRDYRLTLGYWDYEGEVAQDIVDECRMIIEQIHASDMQSSISLKAWAIKHDKDLYGQILDRSRSMAVPLHFDSHLIESADPILRMITDDTPPPRSDIGFTLPGRWKRSIADADVAAELGVTVRVVKGQSPDPDNPSTDPEQGFLDVVTRLAGRAAMVKVATHNHRLAKKSLALLKAAGTPCELELLYGLPVRPMVPLAQEMGVPVRVYVPYGRGWVLYAMYSMLKNPKVIFWLAKGLRSENYREQFPRL